MTPLRLVLVTRRFWPLVGRGAKAMAYLAAELNSQNVPVTVLTARWDPLWPGEISFGGVPVVRLGRPRGRGGKPARYTTALAGWLRQHPDRYDLVYVSMLKEDAHLVLGLLRGSAPVALRAEHAGRRGDCLWQLDSRLGRRIKQRCLKADAVVGPTAAIHRELIAAGYPRGRTHYVPNGVPIRPAADAARKASARAALIEANPGLRMPDGAPLAVYVGRLHEAKGLFDLVTAWPRVLAGRPDARLWLVGDGPYRERLQMLILDLDLLGRVMLAGVFDHVDEMLAAADLFIMPPREEGGSLALLEAMAAGLPIVATDVAGNREILADGQDALLVPAENAGALGAAILRLWKEPDLAGRLGAAARQSAQSRFSQAATADSHRKLFESLVLAHASQERR